MDAEEIFLAKYYKKGQLFCVTMKDEDILFGEIICAKGRFILFNQTTKGEMLINQDLIKYIEPTSRPYYGDGDEESAFEEEEGR